MAYPKGSLWTELPEEYRDWEVIDVSMEDHNLGAENNVVLGDKRMVVVEGTTELQERSRGPRLAVGRSALLHDLEHLRQRLPLLHDRLLARELMLASAGRIAASPDNVAGTGDKRTIQARNYFY